MRCLGCPEEQQSDDQKVTLFNTLLLCSTCRAMAQKAEQELIRARDQAHARSMLWLEQHILRGGLHKGGSGIDGQTTQGPAGGSESPES